MRPNRDASKDANNENRGVPSPSFINMMGRLKNIPIAERIAIARKGGLVTSERKKRSSQLNPIKTGRATSAIDIAKCDECPINSVCHLYKPNAACQIEINIRRNLIGQFKAFGGSNPEDMLLEIMKAYMKLEKVIEDDPSFYKLNQQVYLLINLYKIKYGEKVIHQKG